MAALTESQRKQLLSNPNVLKVTNTNVSYTSEFKIKSVKSYLAGKNPEDIFRTAKIELSWFKEDYARHTIRRWRLVYEESGHEGLKGEKRGKSATGRPKTNFKSMEEELKHLRMEVFILKKLHALADSEKKKGSR